MTYLPQARIFRRSAVLLLGVVAGGLLQVSASAQPARLPTAAEVKAVAESYQAERAQVVKDGIAKRSLPGLMEKADAMAKKADEALAGGRLLQASELYRQARWQLPYQPAQLPEHVALIIGNPRLRHGGQINALAFSTDGKKLATASSDGTCKIWDLGNGHEICAFTGHTDRVRFVALTPDGKTAVSAGAEKDIKVWDAATAKELRTIEGLGAYVSALTVSRDGKYVIAAHVNAPGSPNQASLCVYELGSGKRIRTTSDFRGRVAALTFNPAGTLLAVGDETGALRLWQYPLMIENVNQPAYWTQQDPTGATYAVAFSPDGQTLVRCGQLDVKIYATVQPGSPPRPAAPRRTIALPNAQPCAVFSKDGKALFTGGSDGQIRFWDPETGQQLGTFKGHGGPLNALVFNPQGNQLASASSDFMVRLWDFDIVLLSRDFAGHKGAVWMAAFSPDGTKIVSASADRTLKVWDVATGKDEVTLEGHTAPVTVALFSPDGKQIASAGGDKLIRLWDARTGKQRLTCTGHTGTVTALDFSADGTRLVSGGADRKVKIWDAATGKELLSIDDHPSVVAAVAFRSDGKQIAVGSIDQTITLYDPAGKRQQRWTAHGNAVTCLAYSPNSQLLASGGADAVVQVWPLATPGTGSVRLSGHVGPISMVAFRNDNTHLVSGGSDQLVRLWKVEGSVGKEVQTFRGHKDWVTSVAFSRDGYHVVSASVDRLVKVWEITSRDVPLLAEHSSAIETLTFSPDNKYLVSGSADHTIKVWDRVKGTEIATLTGHSAAVMSLAISGDSKLLISSGYEGAIRLWDLNPPRERPRSQAQLQSFGRLRRYSPYIALDPTGKKLFVWLQLNEARVSAMVEAYNPESGQQLFSFFEDNRKINSMSFAANGKLAAVGAKDGSVRLWNLEQGGKVEPGGDWFLFDKVGFADLALTPDAATLVATSNKGEVKIADIKTRKVRHAFKAHESPVMICVVSPDGKRCATLGKDHTIKLWDLETGKELRRWVMSTATTGSELVVNALTFAPDGRHLATANANTTIYLLELP